ncbi:MAG: hypothetical protein ABEJ03_03635 [Candidatus Nanohaloarchaea archaeon]
MKRRKYLKDAGAAALTTAGYFAARRTCLPADNSPFTANIDIYEVGGDSNGVSPGHVVGDLARRVFDRINREVRNETQVDVKVKSLEETLEGDSIEQVYDSWGEMEETASGEANLYIHPGDLEGESLGLGASGPECFPGTCGNRYSSDTSHSVMINGEKLECIDRAPLEVVMKDSRERVGERSTILQPEWPLSESTKYFTISVRITSTQESGDRISRRKKDR